MLLDDRAWRPERKAFCFESSCSFFLTDNPRTSHRVTAKCTGTGQTDLFPGAYLCGDIVVTLD